MRPTWTMRHALADPDILGTAMPGDSWLPWRTLLIAAMGEELSREERAIFTELTGREAEPGERVSQFWAICGRRAGKTRAAGTLGAYVAGCCDFSACLAPGERGVLPVLAASKSQATRAFAHIKGVLEGSPMLSELIDGEPTANTIRLRVPVDIEIRPADFKTIRGITAVAAVSDEISFWDIEGSANPDKEILAALKPALLTTGGPLWVISSPYAKSGELYKAYRRHYGPNGAAHILVAKAPSLTLNPTLDKAVIAEAYAEDAEVAASEYGGEFRSDLADFVTREVVEACISAGARERLPTESVDYRAFADPSGGANDAMTLGIGHEENGVAILDLLVERRPPFSPETVVAEFASLLRSYGLSSVTGDRYGAEWTRGAFRRHGIEYHHAERTRSEIYLNFLPMLNSRRVDLLDSDRLVQQLVGLKRRVTGGGREAVDHAPGAHDDLANAAAGVLTLFALKRPVQPAVFGTYGHSGGGPHPLVRYFGVGAQRDTSMDLPPPAYITAPQTDAQREAARLYYSRRGHA